MSRLEAIIADALAVTRNERAEVDEKALLAELDAELVAASERAEEMAPVIERVEADLRAALSNAPPELEHVATRYRFATIKWRPDPLPMPREITAFVALSRLEAAAHRCRYFLAKARYEKLREPGDACDCAAKVEAPFMFHRPEAPLKLIESSGVPYAAMDYEYVCEACGMKWLEEEGHDDMGSHSTWHATRPRV